MPAQRRWKLIDLQLSLLQSALAENLLTRLHRLGNVAHGKGFRHSHQLDITWLTPGTAAGDFHPPPYFRQIRRNALHQHR
jgi:hypothetical protein